jgi:CxxC-x17-CxxC domain-containing protein
MTNFKKEGFRKGSSAFAGKPRFGGGKRFGGPSRGFDRDRSSSRDDRGERELFKATCASCHKICEVPFRPTGDKPVYCRECFGNTAGNDRPVHRGDRTEFRRHVRPHRDERPLRREEAPAPDRDMQDLKRQLTNLETKVDSILAAVSSQILKAAGSHTEVAEQKPKAVRKTTTKKAAATALAKKKVAKKAKKKVQ